MIAQRRHILRIELTDKAKQELSKLRDRLGMTQIATRSRLVEWFSRQGERLHGIAPGRFPQEVETEIADMLLRRPGWPDSGRRAIRHCVGASSLGAPDASAGVGGDEDAALHVERARGLQEAKHCVMWRATKVSG